MRAIIESYYDTQDRRIEVENQIRSIEQGKAEGDNIFLQESVLARLKLIEEDTEKRMLQYLKEYPIYREFLKEVKGVGPIISAGLISWIEKPDKFATMSKLWCYAGLAVDQETGKAVKRTKGQKINWNPRMKVLCWKIGEAFVKTKGPGRQLYEESRTMYDTKFPDESKGHQYAMAKRRAVKIFLGALYMKWREMEGLSEERPYIYGRDNHSHVIDWKYFVS